MDVLVLTDHTLPSHPGHEIPGAGLSFPGDPAFMFLPFFGEERSYTSYMIGVHTYQVYHMLYDKILGIPLGRKEIKLVQFPIKKCCTCENNRNAE